MYYIYYIELMKSQRKILQDYKKLDDADNGVGLTAVPLFPRSSRFRQMYSNLNQAEEVKGINPGINRK